MRYNPAAIPEPVAPKYTPTIKNFQVTVTPVAPTPGQVTHRNITVKVMPDPAQVNLAPSSNDARFLPMKTDNIALITRRDHVSNRFLSTPVSIPTIQTYDNDYTPFVYIAAEMRCGNTLVYFSAQNKMIRALAPVNAPAGTQTHGARNNRQDNADNITVKYHPFFSIGNAGDNIKVFGNSHYRTVAARKALFLVRLMSFLCSQKSHKKDDMKHIKELQLLLSEYFNLSGHNLECLSFFVIGMFMVQTVNLAKLSKTFSTATKSESNYKRLQRFIRRLKFSDDALFLMIRKVFNLTGPLTLCLDRTNWKFGKTHINYLVVSIAYKGISIPFIWSLLPDKKRGSSDFNDRRNLFDRLLKFIDPTEIKVLLGDREFLSGDWAAYLKSKGIDFIMRAKENVTTYHKGKTRSFNQVFSNLPTGKVLHLKKRCVVGCDLYVSAKKLKSGELLILASNRKFADVFDQYRIRWEIETLFSAVKKRGFDLEATHLTDPQRLSNLFFVVSIAFVWAYRQGDFVVKNKPIKLKNHGYPQHSIVRHGLDVVTKAISEIVCNSRKIIASIRLVFKLNISKNTTAKLLGVL